MSEPDPTNRFKYPRTLHFPWSPGATADDRVHAPANIPRIFGGRRVVKTEKMDGENTTIYHDGYCHARSLDSAHHPSRTWVKAEAARIRRDLPDGWRVFVENVYAQHSIRYDRLPAYCLVFGIANERNEALAWDQVEEWCGLLDLHTVPVLYRGLWDEAAIRNRAPGHEGPDILPPSAFGNRSEGYVVRTEDGFPLDQFSERVAKYVRPNHVTTDDHWMHQAISANGLDVKSGTP